MGKNNPLICALVWICVGVAVLRMSKRQSDWRHGKVPKWLTHVWEVWGGGKNGCHVGLERPRRVGGGEVATWLAGQGRQTETDGDRRRRSDWQIEFHFGWNTRNQSQARIAPKYFAKLHFNSLLPLQFLSAYEWVPFSKYSFQGVVHKCWYLCKV